MKKLFLVITGCLAISSLWAQTETPGRKTKKEMRKDRIDAMVCPVGLTGITSKLPAAIAASVCAQLLMVWEAQQIAALEAAAPLRLAASR